MISNNADKSQSQGLQDLRDTLYREQPQYTLYHYTTLAGLTGIVSDRALFATELRYLSDSSEMAYAVSVLSNNLRTRLATNPAHVEVEYQLEGWLSARIRNGHQIFASCFTRNGNLLSQWRGYCGVGDGVSLGFSPEFLSKCAQASKFSLGRCIYDLKRQHEIAGLVVSELIRTALVRGPDGSSHPKNSYYAAFAELEDETLEIAALLKNPMYKEEDEWRAISPIVKNYVEAPVAYRAGRSTLIPYIPFSLIGSDKGTMELDHVFVGPSPLSDLSVAATSNFLSKNKLAPRHGVQASMIPERRT